MTTYRIHGDNIVECERIANYIINSLDIEKTECTLISPSTLEYYLRFTYFSNSYEWNLILLPGFNKAGKRRWEKNIFDILSTNGSFLSETPDAIVTKLDNNAEEILFSIEFCSALQAGNQAWQRSGRAYSTGKAGCPYIYVVDFVKYELDNKTRARKSLRFPNPIVPYSYNAFSAANNIFVAETYIKSEEYSPKNDTKLKDFDETIFSEKELGNYMIKKMCGIDTSAEEKNILESNTRMIKFMANSFNGKNAFSFEDWNEILNSKTDIVDYSINKNYFSFRKKIAKKSHHGKSKRFQNLVETNSIGIARNDLPFGIIPKDKRKAFALGIEKIYPTFDKDIINSLQNDKSNLIVCIMKGFKPRGDDNRPDRGLLPLISMLSNNKIEVLSYIYGPIVESNYKLLTSDPKKLADYNGFWKVILSLNDFIIYDSTIIGKKCVHNEFELISTDKVKSTYITNNERRELRGEVFPSSPTEFHENDVATAIHYLFKHILNDVCFEGLCNPPGGDWSGFSIIDEHYEKRWLSLPRDSKVINGKRPDHIIQLDNILDKPVLLSIESKENSRDLEASVGTGLKYYIQELMKFAPSVQKAKDSVEWVRGRGITNYNKFEVISAAAYLKNTAQNNETVFLKSKCDMLIILEPQYNGWDVSIVTNTKESAIIKKFLCNATKGAKNIEVH